MFSVRIPIANNMPTEADPQQTLLSRTDVLRLVIGGLIGALSVMMVIGAVIIVGIYTTQANRILILTVVAVTAAALVLLCYFKPLNASCLRQETEVEASDDPPAYADAIKMEIPPPSYYMVVTDDLYNPSTSFTPIGAGFFLPETPLSKRKAAGFPSSSDTPRISRWLVGASASPALVRPGAGSPMIIRSTGSPIVIRSSGNPVLIRSFDSPAVVRSMGGRITVSPLVNSSINRSPSSPALNVCAGGPSLSKSPSSPALNKLFTGSSLTVHASDLSTRSPSNPALNKLLDNSPGTSGQCVYKMPTTLYLRKSPSTPALGKLLAKSPTSPTVNVSFGYPHVQKAFDSSSVNMSPSSPSVSRSPGRTMVFAPHGRPVFGRSISSSAVSMPSDSPLISRSPGNPSTNRPPGSPSSNSSSGAVFTMASLGSPYFSRSPGRPVIKSHSNLSPSSSPVRPCVTRSPSKSFVKRTHSNLSVSSSSDSPSLSRSPGSPHISRSPGRPTLSRVLSNPCASKSPVSPCVSRASPRSFNRSLSNPPVSNLPDSPCINRSPGSPCISTSSGRPPMSRSSSSSSAVSNDSRALRQRAHRGESSEREGRTREQNTGVVLNPAGLSLPQGRSDSTPTNMTGNFMEPHVFWYNMQF